jgi:hypothetical protein
MNNQARADGTFDNARHTENAQQILDNHMSHANSMTTTSVVKTEYVETTYKSGSRGDTA